MLRKGVPEALRPVLGNRELVRTRHSGHVVALRRQPEGRVEARGARVERAEVAVLLDQPLCVVAGGEVANGVADVVDGLDDAAVDGLLLQRPEEPLDDVTWTPRKSPFPRRGVI